MKRTTGPFALAAAAMLFSPAGAWAQLSPCYAGFEISSDCITARGLDQKAAAYRQKLDQAMATLGASYKVSLRLVNNPVEAGYEADSIGDVFTDVVRNEDMRNESFIVNVTTDFLEKQPEILFEASSLHEICHVMNDDLTGFHRNGPNIETAEERCVMNAAGESRYRQYLQAYATYQHWDNATFEGFLEKVKSISLVPAPNETDSADTLAIAYFRAHSDGKEHFLVYNGELHDENPQAAIEAGRPLIFFHNHPVGKFPTPADFGTAALYSSMVYRENPHLAVEFRVVQLGDETSVVSYGFKGAALAEIRHLAQGDSDRLAHESFTEYLQHACPDEVCHTHPQYFLWPSDKFFLHYRPQN